MGLVIKMARLKKSCCPHHQNVGVSKENLISYRICQTRSRQGMQNTVFSATLHQEGNFRVARRLTWRDPGDNLSPCLEDGLCYGSMTSDEVSFSSPKLCATDIYNYQSRWKKERKKCNLLWLVYRVQILWLQLMGFYCSPQQLELSFILKVVLCRV